jgi:hypothetical protein
MLSFKKLTCKGTLVFIRFIDWKYNQPCWYFRPSFVNYCPSNLLSGSPTPALPPSLCQSTVYSIGTDSMRLGGGGGGGCWLSSVGDHILQEFNIL